MRRVFRRRHTEVEVHTVPAPALPPLDETTFQQLLEAAYVIQEQREAVEEQKEPRAAAPAEKSSPPIPQTVAETRHADAQSLSAAEVLALIVETQEQLRSQVRDLPAAGKLIAERLEQVTNAAGVAIAVIREDHLEFCAATGVLSSLAGSSAPVGSSLPELLQAHSWSSVELSIRHDTKCPIVFPIFHEGRTTGLLHLSFPNTEKLEEHQIRSCQVMAGLMGEAISRVSELEWKQTLAAERNTMMQILERLRPQLERLASESKNASPENLAAVAEDKDTAFAGEKRQPDKLTIFPATDEPKFSISSTPSCQQCGFAMKEDEVFCGRCGAPQLDLSAPLTLPHEETLPEVPPGLAKNVEAPRNWQAPPDTNAEPEPDVSLPPSLEEALAHLPTRNVVERFRPRVNPLIDTPSATVEPLSTEVLRDTGLRDGSIDLQATEHAARVPLVSDAETELSQPDTTAEMLPGATSQAASELVQVSSEATAGVTQSQSPKSSPWSSAAEAQQWLKSLQSAQSPARVWINKHRADLWVVVSLILLLLALSGWGSRTAIYGAAQTKVVQPSLTLFERFLVALNLAEPPPAPVNMGNPNTRVWIDQHTALYYCPGADLYGKTAEGRFATQREAQLDEFQPAARAYCE